jgi:hypothetical protein
MTKTFGQAMSQASAFPPTQASSSHQIFIHVVSEERVTMLHKSELGEHADRFPHDNDGNVPEDGDHWSAMSFEHGPHDPDEDGIDEAEKAKRTKYLDDEWWPALVAKVREERDSLAALPGGSPIKRWRDQVMHEPHEQHGYNTQGYESETD